MKREQFIYREDTFTLLDIVTIKNMDFAICRNNHHEYSYFKRNTVHERTTYVPFGILISILPQYQEITYQNIKNVLDSFVETLNISSYSVRAIDCLKNILEVHAPYFKKNNRLILSKEYFDALFMQEKNSYRRRSISELLELEEKKETKKSKNSRFPLPQFIYMVMIVISAIGFLNCYSIYSNWKEEGNKTKSLTSDLLASTEITEEVDGEIYVDIEEEYAVADDTSIPTGVTKTSKYGNDYWTYMTTPMINVDFSKLKQINSDTVGWIYVNNTNINYPFVQTTDNSYYLTHAFDKSKNAAGWLFADYRSDLTNLKNNTVIYGHGRVDQVMFGSLEKVLEKSWYTNSENQIIKISTPTTNTLWQIVSIYTIQAESYYLTHNFENDESYQKFLDTIVSRSIYDFKVSTTTSDKILTLSTCLNYDGERIVVHAKLVKVQER